MNTSAKNEGNVGFTSLSLLLFCLFNLKIENGNILISVEEAKKCVAEMEMAKIENQMAKTNLDGRGEILQNRDENDKDAPTRRGNEKN